MDISWLKSMLFYSENDERSTFLRAQAAQAWCTIYRLCVGKYTLSLWKGRGFDIDPG